MAYLSSPANIMVDPVADGVLLSIAFGGHECAYCLSAIATGERWVREKIYEPCTGNAPRYRRYHADLFLGEELSCWEKQEVERDVARTAGRAA